MTVLRDSAIMGAATFLVGAVFMEIGDDEGVEFDKTFPYIATFFSGAIGYYLLKKTNITDSFSAEEKVTREYIEHDYMDITKFGYRGNEASYLYDADSKYGQLFFINSFKEARMGQGDSLPFAERIDEIKGKSIEPKKVFKAFLDRLCESCDEPIYKHGIGNCFECSRDFDKEYKYKIEGFKDQYKNNFYSYKNRYCRKCLFYTNAFGDTNMPNDFDRKGANYRLGTARCDEHFNEMVEENYPVEIAEGKKIPKHSLYDIENYDARREMALRRRRND